MDAWEVEKQRSLARLREDATRGKVDSDIMGLLELINSLEDYYTTSSCSGRIQIAEVRYPWEKWDYRVLGKWHRPITLEEAHECISKGKQNVWYMVQPPIVHVAARTLEAARRLLVIARQSGFKHSGIQGIRSHRIIVEVLCMDKMEVPLIYEGRWLFRREELRTLVSIGNELLLKGKRRLRNLEDNLRRSLRVISYHE